MRTIRIALLAGCIALLATGAYAEGLNILLTNDDGYDSSGITAMRDALETAGHTVTIVAPATNQSGKGGSINTDAFNFTPGEGLMLLVHHGGGTWSLEGTPADSVKAGLDIVMAANPPDLIVSGLNFGQNIGKPSSNESGTEGAALHAVFRGIPAIAGSIERLISENPDFPSSEAANAPAADFVASVIAELRSKNGDRLFVGNVMMLNINFPVPYADIQGVEMTNLADGSDIELPLFDPSQGFPAFGIPPLPFPACADAMPFGGACFAGVGVGFSPDESAATDLGAFRDRFISITSMSGDMSTDGGGLGYLKSLTP
jgi:5'/3'-nucleotidase SurE